MYLHPFHTWRLVSRYKSASAGNSPIPSNWRIMLLSWKILDRWEMPMTIPLEFHDGKAAFALRDNPAATLDSEGDYEPGTSIRGLKLICKWGSTEKHYTCMVRSDYFVDFSEGF